MKQRTLTLTQLYRDGVKRLEEAGIGEAALDAWYLLEHVTGISKAGYYADPERAVSGEAAKIYDAYIIERSKHIPLQHITREQEFMGYSFYVDEHVLIPRQDTEILVEEAMGMIRPGMRILDMCTGSGCILLSILKMERERYRISDLDGTGVDISGEALAVAEKNRERLGVEATFIQSDLFEGISGEKKYDLIVSNPPYIRTSVIEELQEEVRFYDPYIALDGKEDGLFFYRRILAQAETHLKPQGWLMFEIGHDQGGSVSELMKMAGYDQVIVKKDLAGLDRVVSGRLL